MIFGLSDGTSGGFLCVRFREISRNVSWYSYDVDVALVATLIEWRESSDHHQASRLLTRCFPLSELSHA